MKDQRVIAPPGAKVEKPEAGKTAKENGGRFPADLLENKCLAGSEKPKEAPSAGSAEKKPAPEQKEKGRLSEEARREWDKTAEDMYRIIHEL